MSRRIITLLFLALAFNVKEHAMLIDRLSDICHDSICRSARVGRDVWPVPYADDEPPIRETSDGKDMNHMQERDDDVRFNFSDLNLFVVDGECVGPNLIGVDYYVLERVRDTLSTFRVNGLGLQNEFVDVRLDAEGCLLPTFWANEQVGYIFRYKSTKGKLHLLTLDDVRREFCPQTKGKCVFMINKFFILSHQELYRLDHDFILRVDTEDSRLLFPELTPHFTIVRIFTRTHHNWHSTPRY